MWDRFLTAFGATLVACAIAFSWGSLSLDIADGNVNAAFAWWIIGMLILFLTVATVRIIQLATKNSKLEIKVRYLEDQLQREKEASR